MGKSILRFDIFEAIDSVDEVQNEILENVSYISDILGEPSVGKRKYTEGYFIYTLTWNIGFNISSENDVSTLSDFYPVMKEISELRSAKDRMDKFDFRVSISDKIILSVYPKEKSNGVYKFIIGQAHREIQMNKVDIIRFFRDRSVDVINIEEDYSETAETCDVILKLSSNEYSLEFVQLLKQQIDKCLEDDFIDREIGVSSSINSIIIFPGQEKTYVVIG